MRKDGFLMKLIENEPLNSQIKLGLTELNNENYEQAWDCFYKVYNTKMTKTEDKGKACYFLYYIMKVLNDDNDFVNNIKNIDADLGRMISNKEVSKDYPRRYIGRKYLEKSAQYGYSLGLIDYSVMCVGYGAFAYKDEMKNIQAGLDWAAVMEDNKDGKVRAIAYMIYAKYNYMKRVLEYKEDQKNDSVDLSKETILVKNFGENILKAYKEDSDNQYIKYYLSVLYSNVLFSAYENKEYYDPKKGYDILCELSEECDDDKLLSEIYDFKKVIKKHYPKFEEKQE